MSLYYKIVVFAGAAMGLGWGVGRYGAAGIIASMLAGGLFGAFFGFLEEDNPDHVYEEDDPDQEDKLEK